MAAQQRIIGGGLLLVGIAIVLVLIYAFTFNSGDPEEAAGKLLDEDFPAYKTAVANRDYLSVKKRAGEILETLEDGGRAATLKYIQGEATSGDRDAQAFQKLIEDGGFDKNAEGQFAFEGGWFPQTVHQALSNLNAAVEGELKLVREAREVAAEAQRVLDEAREGSGKPLEAPAANVPRDDAPVLDPNPIYQNDAELYRAFGVKAGEVRQALKAAGEGARAKSARLRWNRPESRATRAKLAEALQAIPETATQLERASVEVQRNARTLAGESSAQQKLAALLRKAAVRVGAGLENPHKAAFDESRDQLTNGDAIAQILLQEARMLQAHKNTVRDLGKSIVGDFVAE